MDHPKLSDYSKAPVEILIGVLTVAPIVILAVFYAEIPNQIPVFVNLRGEVQAWATKRVASVFRVPAMAMDLQLICLLMKYGTVKSQAHANLVRYERRVTTLTSTFWDLVRCLVAFKMAAASLDLVFFDRSLTFSTTLWLVTWLAALVSIFAAGIYGYRLWQPKRAQQNSPVIEIKASLPRDQLIAGFIYFNRNDPALFNRTHLLNFGNKWVFVLIASLVAYPFLVFVPT